MNGIPRLTTKNLEEWRGVDDRTEVLLDYIDQLQRQIERLIHLGDITQDDEGVFFGEILAMDTKVERDVKLATLLVAISSGLLDKDGVLLYA